MSYQQKLTLFISTLVLGQGLLLPISLWAGDYRNSAHGGSNTAGVQRSSMTSGGTVYAAGNCGHCHEMHASVAGAEPAPDNSGPNPYTLFAKNFDPTAIDPAAIPGSYGIEDNFCFQCHSGSSPVQNVTNADYSTTFGGGTSVTQPYIMETFNQKSYHNLQDIDDFFDPNPIRSDAFKWYTKDSNPCNGCHNPHLAKKNYPSTSPPLSAISKPDDHFSLWGETMADYLADKTLSSYIPPTSEPDGLSTPDYVSFCLECHGILANKDITSTTIYVDDYTVGKTLSKIDWSSDGDKHGGYPREGGLDAMDPYPSGSTPSNLIMSCLDCHEPHGSRHIMLLRDRVNGGTISPSDTVSSLGDIGFFCRQCHLDDAAATWDGPKTENSWEWVHHYSDDAPYEQKHCKNCHSGGDQRSDVTPNLCDDCHSHGMTKTVTNLPVESRKTF
jgi:hypothetical protein